MAGQSATGSGAAAAAPRAAVIVSPTNTLFADVSEFQRPVDDTYPYRVLSIRVCDGTYRDHNFAANYAWMRTALSSGRLTFGIVYTYCRANWQANANTVRSMIDGNGGLDPRVSLMLDVEQGGNPRGDNSGWINQLYWNLADYAGSRSRVIGYGNIYDLDSMWPTKPSGVRIIVAAYGSNPDYPGKVAHQYTDGTGYGGLLPQGAPPFGNCDMNSADGLNPGQFAAACGIPTPPPGDSTMAVRNRVRRAAVAPSRHPADPKEYPMATMTKDERQAFLADVHVGVIAVEREERAPLAVPIWYDYEPGGEVVLWTTAGSVKDHLIRAAGRFAITVQHEQPPYKYVTAEGPVSGIDGATVEAVRAIAVRYLGAEAGGAFAEQNLSPTSLVIRMRPERWLSTDYSKE